MFRKTNKLKAAIILIVGALSIPAQQDNFEAQMRAIEAQLEQVEATARANHTQIDGIMAQGSTFAEKLVWLERNADSHNTYILELTANENVNSHTFQFRGTINITIVLRGDTQNRTLRLRSHGTMFTVNQDITLVLDNNITLQGHNGNNGVMVFVNGGTFRMNDGASITGNTNMDANSYTGGVEIIRGIFEMVGGNIVGNGNRGVLVDDYSNFTMTGGNIINNSNGNQAVQNGGGVVITQNSIFNMNGGTITGNGARKGGGVAIVQNSTFNMNGGTISGNSARELGGGVFVDGVFNMRNGIITNNTAGNNGGGVYVWSNGTFNKTGGTITGHTSDQNNGNVVRDDKGVLARRGHAVFVSETQRRERTAGPDVRMANQMIGTTGGWEN